MNTNEPLEGEELLAESLASNTALADLLEECISEDDGDGFLSDDLRERIEAVLY